MKKITPDQPEIFKRPTVMFTKDEHKLIARHCLDNDMKIGDFLRRAGLHCVEKKITWKK